METTALFDSLTLAVTHLGSGPGVISLALLYSWWMDPVGGRRLALLLGLSWIVNQSLKDWFAVPRPFHLDPGAAPSGAEATAYGYAFPSGHAQGTTTFWFYLAFVHRRRWLYGAACVMVLLVGGSRVFLGVHYLLDVVGGIGIGLVLAWLGVRAPQVWAPPWWAGVGIFLAAFPVTLLGGRYAEAAGLTVGVLLARGDHRLPEGRWRRLGMAVGGLVLLWGTYLVLRPLLGVLPDLPATGAMVVSAETWGGYVRAAALSWLAFGLWPGWVSGRAAKTAEVGASGAAEAAGAAEEDHGEVGDEKGDGGGEGQAGAGDLGPGGAQG